MRKSDRLPTSPYTEIVRKRNVTLSDWFTDDRSLFDTFILCSDRFVRPSFSSIERTINCPVLKALEKSVPIPLTCKAKRPFQRRCETSQTYALSMSSISRLSFSIRPESRVIVSVALAFSFSATRFKGSHSPRLYADNGRELSFAVANIEHPLELNRTKLEFSDGKLGSRVYTQWQWLGFRLD